MAYVDAATIKILSSDVLPVEHLRNMLRHIESELPSPMHLPIVVQYSVSIDSNIIYFTKHLNSDNSRIFNISKSLHMFPTFSNTLVMI